MLLPKQPKETSPTFPEGGRAGWKQLECDFSTLEIIVRKKKKKDSEENRAATKMQALQEHSCVCAHAYQLQGHPYMCPSGASRRHDIIWKLNRKNGSSQLLLDPLVYAQLTADTPLNTSFWDIIAAGKLYSSTMSPVKIK